MEGFNSEIPGSSYSIPSEPPDIRNWFSSYKYDSFVLDTCENFGGMSSEERENDKYDSAIGEINREKEEKVNGYVEIGNADERDNFNNMGDSLHSLSVLSEPSDIRKWFSSYVYESPLLDTNDCFKSYVSRESEGEKHELVNRESINDEFVNSDQFQEDTSHKIFSAKLVRCNSSLVDVKSDSDPLFSEPLDIGNWFPDYAYESPVLDTNDELQDSLSKGTLSNQDKFTVIIDKKICSNGFEKCKSCSPIRHDEQENKSASKDSHWSIIKENLSWQVGVCSEKNLEPNMQFKQEPNSSIYGVDSLSELNRADYQSLDSSKKLIDRKNSFRKSSGTQVRTDKIDGKNDKEKDAGKENGFITTRKNKFERRNDENSQGGPGEILSRCSRKTGDGEKDNGVMRRKVLGETTNGRQCEAKATEITGKWRCPRKGKTLRGPPLKQLRLERWVHRV